MMNVRLQSTQSYRVYGGVRTAYTEKPPLSWDVVGAK